MHTLVRQTRRQAVLFLSFLVLAACGDQEPASQDLYRAVDDVYERVSAGAARYRIIAQIDHARLAAEAGEIMPPARVIIFSDPEVNTPLLERNPLAGLDLPFRVLAFANGASPAVIFTTADFLKRRHGLADGPALRRYQDDILRVVEPLPAEVRVAFDTSPLNEGQGLVELNSSHGFDETIERLRSTILAEGDTLWFGEIDYQAEARPLGVSLPRLTLLLFGAPGPGAKAMADFPRMGLDAFCQKILVYEQPDDMVRVYYNEMPAFANLHHGRVALPHRVINRRMGASLEGAVE